MVSRLGGAFEIVGLRAVMLDVRQYIADGKAIERANESLITSQKKLDASQASRIALDAKLQASQLRVAAAGANLANSRVTAAQVKLNAAGQPTARGVNGRFIPNPNVQAANAGVKAAEKEAADAAREQLSIKGQIVRVDAQIAASEARNLELAAAQTKAAAERKQLFAGLAATAGAVAIVGGTAAAVASAAKFQTTLTKINVLTEATTEQTNQLGKSLLELSKTVPVSPDELGATAYQVLSSGIHDVGEALDITKIAAEGEAVGLGKAADVARTVTEVINAYGKENITAAQAGDILFTAVKEGSGEAADFATSLGRILGIASQAGIKFDALAASVASLTNIGLSAEESVTAIRGAIQAILSPTTQARAALFSVGLSVDSLRKGISGGDFVGTLEELIQKFHGNEAAIEPIIPNIRALTGVISAFGVQGKQTVNILADIDSGGNSLADAFATASQTAANQGKIVKNELNVVLIELGTTVLPAVTAGLRDFVGFLNQNHDAIVQFGSAGIKVVVALLEDFIKGILTAVRGLILLKSAYDSLLGHSAADAAALSAIGTALLWALPGGPLIKGLTTIAFLIGFISSHQNAGGGINTGKGSDKITSALSSQNPRGELEKLNLPGGSKTIDQLLKSKPADEFTQALDKANAEIEKSSKIVLPDLNRKLDDSARAAQLDADEIQNLEKQFRSNSEAAAQFKQIFDFKGFESDTALFAQIPKKLADALNLTAEAAGNVEGMNAVRNAMEQTADKSYQLRSALGAVAEAFQQSASVANQIVLSMAQAAQEASTKALSDLLGQPSREEANLGVNLAQSQAQKASFNAQNDQTLFNIQQQMKQIDQQISAQQAAQKNAQKQQDAANKAQQAQQAANQKASQAAQQAAQDSANQILNQLKQANDLAQAGFDKMNADLQLLIDQTTKTLSDLQSAFLLSNEDLQRQINKAIGAGDTSGALGLVDQQKKAAQDFQQKQKDLTKSTEDLTYQQKILKDQQAQASAIAAAQQAQLDATVGATKSIADNSSATQTNTDSTTTQTDAIQQNVDQLTAHKDALQKQADAIQNQSDKLDNSTKQIQDQIDLYKTQKDVLKALGVAADQTLRSFKDQVGEAYVLIGQIHDSSGAVKDLADKLHLDTIPSINDATTKFTELQDAIRVLVDDGFRNTFIDKGINPATLELQLLAGAAVAVNKSLSGTADQLSRSAASFVQTSSTVLNQILAGASGFKAVTNNIGPSTIKPLSTTKITPPSLSGGAGLLRNAYGGVYDSPTLTWVGDEYKRELVVPLGHPNRARQLLSTIPASLLAPLFAQKSAQAIFAPNIMVTGETLETMEAVAIRAVSSAFRQARTSSSRSGGLITSGIN